MIALSLALGAAGAWLVSRYGRGLGLVDHPVERSSHSRPVPKGGGIGILAAFLLVCVAARASLSLAAPALAVSLLGLWGDRTHISPRLRLAVQFAAAWIAVRALDLPPLYLLPAMVFVVGTANFFNFMDGIDGIAGLSGSVAFGLIGVFAWGRSGPGPEAAVAFGLAAACAGFLPFNLPRAKVFMGDTGSILLGFVFSWLVLRLSRGAVEFLVLCSFLGTFYVDELSTMFVRLRDGENLLRPHRRHFYQLLGNEKGVPHWKVSAGYALVQLAVGLGVWWAGRRGVCFSLGMIIFLSAVFCLYNFNFRRHLPDKAGIE